MFTARLPLRTALALGTMAACFGLILLERMGLLPVLAPLTHALYAWAVVLGAVALLLGVVNVVWVHLRRIQGGQGDWWQSLALVAVLVAVLMAGLVNPVGERSPLLEWVFDSVLAPGASTLFALTAIFLAGAVYQRVRLGWPGGGWVLAGLLLMLLVQTPAAHALLAPAWLTTLAWVVDGPVTATLRGALLGVGLALLVVGVRALWGRRAT